jgi:WD40 repeat protein
MQGEKCITPHEKGQKRISCGPIGEPFRHSTRITSLAFSPNGKLLLMGGNGPLLWDLDTGMLRWPEQVSPGGTPYLLSFRKDGRTFWTVTNSGLFQWDADSGRLVGGVDSQFSGSQPNGWAFSADASALPSLERAGSDTRLKMRTARPRARANGVAKRFWYGIFRRFAHPIKMTHRRYLARLNKLNSGLRPIRDEN